MTAYDCTADVMEHKRKVEYWMRRYARLIEKRATVHDDSKLKEPEKSTFDVWTPRLKETVFGTDEYKAALAGMGEGLKHHYANNRHHPEGHANGINDMSLDDIMEMYCDWLAAAEAKGTSIDLAYLSKRFGIGEQLAQIILNTLKDDDAWKIVNGLPGDRFTPPTTT